MAINKVCIENFTVFKKMEIDFTEGINIFIGENGTGKTHLLKVLYAACQAARPDVYFQDKLTKVFRPEGMRFSRLVRKSLQENDKASLVVYSEDASIQTQFSIEKGGWNEQESDGENGWESKFTGYSLFIPAKEILSHAYNFLEAQRVGNIDFDDTYADIIAYAKVEVKQQTNTSSRKQLLKVLEKILNGTVNIEKEKFYLMSESAGKLEFHLVSEGIRKFALLWQLIKNGTLDQGSVLFWDEPEANINPVHIPILMEMLLELQRNGVQIFIATHDYMVAKYLEVKRNDQDKVMYYSLYHPDAGVQIEKNSFFKDIKENPIVKAFDTLLDEVFNKNLGD